MYSGYFSFRSAAATVQLPELESASMLNGETMIGAPNYVVPVYAPLEQLVFWFYLDVEQLYLVADLKEESSSSASPVPI